MKARAKELKTGDRVTWNTSRGRTTGRVEKKVTRTTKVKTRKVNASARSPEYLVRSEKSGKPAAHKAAALRKI
jgi:Hypervirulence associated proteins TUDOR domain